MRTPISTFIEGCTSSFLTFLSQLLDEFIQYGCKLSCIIVEEELLLLLLLGGWHCYTELLDGEGENDAVLDISQ